MADAGKFVARRNDGAGAWEPRLGEPA